MSSPKQAYIVAGLGFGDESKGSWVDYLCRLHGATLVVRYSGGPQCSHRVVEPEPIGREHAFSQFGSGSFCLDVQTYLGPGMLIEPYAMVEEADILLKKYSLDVFCKLMVDGQCSVITPYHIIANKIREIARGDKRHGSCGMGVGELRGDQIEDNIEPLKAYELWANSWTKLCETQERKMEQLRDVADYNRETRKLYNHMGSLLPTEIAQFYTWCCTTARMPVKRSGTLTDLLKINITVFEGNQGVLLDQEFGFAPHNTWTDCTFRTAEKLCKQAGISYTKVGCLRAYSTRHGAGPFVAQDNLLPFWGLEAHNKAHPWQGNFRVGHFDGVAARYALRQTDGCDELAISHLDYFKSHPWGCVDQYQRNGDRIYNLFGLPDADCISVYKPLSVDYSVSPEIPMGITEEISSSVGMSVSYISTGPTFRDKRQL